MIIYDLISVSIILISIVLVAFYKVSNRNALKTLKWLFYDFSGVRYIKSLIFHEDYKSTTFIFWFFGIYLGFYGFASQRFESRLSLIDNRLNQIITQASNNNINALSRISKIQNEICYSKTFLLSPTSIFLSLLVPVKYSDISSLPKEIVSDCRDNLNWVDLTNSNLSGIDLSGGEMMHVLFKNSNCCSTSFAGKQKHFPTRPSPTNLLHSNFDSSFLAYANFNWAILNGVSFNYAKLSHANFMCCYLKCNISYPFHATFHDADLSFTDFRNAHNLDWHEIAKAKTLYNAVFEKNVDSILKLNCPNLFSLERYTAIQNNNYTHSDSCNCNNNMQKYFDVDNYVNWLNSEESQLNKEDCPLCEEMVSYDSLTHVGKSIIRASF